MLEKIKQKFNEHPNKAGETYLQHGKFASKTGFKLIYAGVTCLIHAILPFSHKTTASDLVLEMMEIMKKRNKVEDNLNENNIVSFVNNFTLLF